MDSLSLKEKKNNIVDRLSNIGMMFFWMLFEYSLIHVTVSLSNVPKFFYFYIGASSLIAIVILVRKVKLFKWYIIIPLMAFWGNALYFYFIHRYEYGYQYIAMVMAKYIMFAMFAIVIVDEIIKSKRSILEKKKIGLFCVFCSAIAVTVILGHDYVLPVLCPITALYITAINALTWKKMMIHFSLSMYFVFYLYTLVSFILKPNEYVAGRYWGVFNFPVVGALLAALGIISGAYLWFLLSKKIRNKKFNIFFLILFMIYPFYFILLTMDRAVILGLTSVLVFSAIFLFGKKVNYKKRLIIVIPVLVIILLLFAVGAILIYKTEDRVFDEISRRLQSFPDVFSSMFYFASRFKYGSKYSYFEQGTILNGIDYFTSFRLGLWYLALKEVKFLGGSPITFVIQDIEYHTHNTYVEWFLRVGWIGGSLLCSWIVYYLIVSIKHIIRKDSLSVFSFVWISFCLTFMMVERELWTEMPLFLLLILQYPLIMGMKDNTELE